MYLLEKQGRMCQAANKLKEFLTILLNGNYHNNYSELINYD